MPEDGHRVVDSRRLLEPRRASDGRGLVAIDLDDPLAGNEAGRPPAVGVHRWKCDHQEVPASHAHHDRDDDSPAGTSPPHHRGAQAQQREDDRVEGKVVVVDVERDHLRQPRGADRQQEAPDRQAHAQQARGAGQGRSVVAECPGPDGRPSPIAHRDQRSPDHERGGDRRYRDRPQYLAHERDGENAERHEDQPEPHGRRPLSEAPPRAEQRPHFAESRQQLADEHGYEGQDDDADCRRQPRQRASAGPPELVNGENRNGGDQHPRQHMRLAREDHADPHRHPPARVAAPTSLERGRQREGGRGRHEGWVPQADGRVDHLRRDGGEEPGHEPGHRTAGCSGHPPDEDDGGNPTERDPEGDGGGIVAPGGQGEERPNVVEDRPVVDPTGRRRGPKERQLSLDDRPDRQHLLALVGVPGSPRGQVGKAQEGRQDDQPHHHGNVGGRAAQEASQRSTRGGRPSVRSSPLDVVHAAGVLDRAPCRWKAPGGSTSSGAPAASARARPMFTAS